MDAITRLREQIDEVDARIVELLNERMKLAAAIGAEKRTRSLEVTDPKREASLLLRLESLSKGPISGSALQAIFKEIMAASREIQREPAQLPP